MPYPMRMVNPSGTDAQKITPKPILVVAKTERF
jgi:hypothetical protein